MKLEFGRDKVSFGGVRIKTWAVDGLCRETENGFCGFGEIRHEIDGISATRPH